MNDAKLLQEFAEHRSEAAFRTLVERHLPLVFGTARRVTGNSALAEEIAQTVFILLARKAPEFGPGTILTGWIYRTTRFVASRAMRSEQRRRRREEEAVAMHLANESESTWQSVAPQIDDAIGRLNETDRGAILHRFFEQRGLREVGTALGISEEAAKKRVTRALEKLRLILTRRGTKISVAALLTGLTQEGSQAAVPAGLTATIVGTTLAKLTAAGVAAGGGSALLVDVLAAMRWARIKTVGTLLIGAVAVVVFTSFVVRYLGTVFRAESSTINASFASTSTESQTNFTPMEVGGGTGGSAEATLQMLALTVLDAETVQPVPGAEVTHTLMLWKQGVARTPLRSDSNGVVRVLTPPLLPELGEITQFQVYVRAAGYAPRDVMWLSSTGGAIATISSNYTVRLERGITVAGQVFDDTGMPLSGVCVATIGSNYRGYSESRDGSGKLTSKPTVRIDDHSSYSRTDDPTARDAVLTDLSGRFELLNYPSDLHALQLEFITPEGARKKVCTPEGKSLSAEVLLEITFAELKTGTARFVLPRGVTVEGSVVDVTGKPVGDAIVVEAVMRGNLDVLSRTKTDASGRFQLEKRAPREVMLAASADGHGGVSTVVTISPGMKPVRLQLPPERPLRGRVVNEVGEPLAGLSVNVVDHENDGLALTWNSKTDDEGRFVWMGAPTNEVMLAIQIAGLDARLVRLAVTTNEQVVFMRTGRVDFVRITGRVKDAESGEPVEQFTVKVHGGSRGSLPEYLKRTTQGARGKFEAEARADDFENGVRGAWLLVIEAEGYEPLMTRFHRLNAGDQHFELELQRGGAVEGTVFSPRGGEAAGAQFAFAQTGNAVHTSGKGQLSRALSERSDSAGRFRFLKPLKATALVVFHDNGWAVIPMLTGSHQLNVTLQPWAEIEGTLFQGDQPVARERIGLDSLGLVSDVLQVLYTTVTDGGGHYVFPKVPAGEFIVSWQPTRWVTDSVPYLKVRQSSATLRAGESRTLDLGGEGRKVVGRLQLPPALKSHGLTNVIVLLSNGATEPTAPSYSYYATAETLNAAVLNHRRDPAVLAARRNLRTFLGLVAADGAVTFYDVPAGRYMLEAKQYDLASNSRNVHGDAPVLARLDLPVTVLDGQADDEGAIDIGMLKLEATR